MSKAIVSEYLTAKASGEKVSSPKVSLTNNLVEWLPACGLDYEVLSNQHAGLRVRVRASGKKAFEVRLNGVRRTLCPAGSLPVSHAVALYRQAVSETLTPKPKADTTTLAETLELYLADSKLRAGTIANYRSAVHKKLSSIAHKPMRDIDQATIKRLFTEISATAGPVAANNTFKVVRALFTFTRELDPTFPAPPTQVLNSGRRRRKSLSTWHEETPRDGRIALADLPAWFEQVDRLAMDYRGNGELARDYLLFVLLTGCRRREASSLRWDDVYSDRIVFRDTKNGRDHTLPLTDSLNQVLSNRRGCVGLSNEPVFPITEPKRFTQWVAERSGIKFTVHDLRRTFAGIASHELEISEKVVAVILNHSTDKTITARYAGTLGLTKLKPKLEEIQRFILSHRSRTPADVVQLDLKPVKIRPA